LEYENLESIGIKNAVERLSTMKDQNEPKQGSAVELLVAGTSAILGLLTSPGVAAVGAMGSFSLLAWHIC
jgi:hypothetical protein